jgi:hypothetical protein
VKTITSGIDEPSHRRKRAPFTLGSKILEQETTTK